MQVSGSCHCGNIKFSLMWEPDPVVIAARACTCTFCTKHGGVWTSYPAGVLDVVFDEPARVSRHVFGTETADFHVCARCGVVPVVTSRIDDRIYAVVNVNTFDGVDPALVQRSTVTHGVETTEARLARRKRNWIADVRIVATSSATSSATS
jgi:hypothetical protein